MSQYPTKNPLADELFALVERDAGFAHISDGIDVLTESQIMSLAEGARDRHQRCVKLLDAFLLHHWKRIARKRDYEPIPKRYLTRASGQEASGTQKTPAPAFRAGAERASE